MTSTIHQGFPASSEGKESTCNEGYVSSLPELGRSPGEGNSYTLQYCGLKNSMECTVHGVASSWDMIKWFSFHIADLQYCVSDVQQRYSGIYKHTYIYSISYYFPLWFNSRNFSQSHLCKRTSVRYFLSLRQQMEIRRNLSISFWFSVCFPNVPNSLKRQDIFLKRS